MAVGIHGPAVVPIIIPIMGRKCVPNLAFSGFLAIPRPLKNCPDHGHIEVFRHLKVFRHDNPLPLWSLLWQTQRRTAFDVELIRERVGARKKVLQQRFAAFVQCLAILIVEGNRMIVAKVVALTEMLLLLGNRLGN